MSQLDECIANEARDVHKKLHGILCKCQDESVIREAMKTVAYFAQKLAEKADQP